MKVDLLGDVVAIGSVTSKEDLDKGLKNVLVLMVKEDVELEGKIYAGTKPYKIKMKDLFGLKIGDRALLKCNKWCRKEEFTVGYSSVTAVEIIPSKKA